MLLDSKSLQDINSVVLTGLEPIWLTPEIDEATGVPIGIPVAELERVLDQKPIALLLTEPGYLGTISELSALIKKAHENSIPVIVDAAWGGCSQFSVEHRALMDGVEFADSVCWDAHKMMGIPLVCSAFLVKDSEVLARVCAHGNVAHYLFHEESRNIDAGRYSLQCGRRNDALKLWLAWRECGDAGWAAQVDRYMDLAAHLESLVDAHPQLEMMSSRMWTNVCFRLNPEGYTGELNELNSEVRKRLMHNGNFMVSRSNIGEDVIFRAVIANPKINNTSLERLAEEICALGDEVLRGLPN